ncbi:counting factor associated protein D-like [Cydia strobilella]|uniref:counting factor associated protein D-like n=1 Tax=Cydia strobilella TaxID=1100964 RepID=UPI003003BB7A
MVLIGRVDEQPLVVNSQEPVNYEQTTVEVEIIPFSDGSPIFDTSERMIQSFLRQTPVAPEEPAVIPDLDLPARLPVNSPSSFYGVPITAASPPLPDFNRSLHLRVDLTVPSSDYTEAFDIQWHSESNTAKTVVEDGSTVIYRAPVADGRIQFLEEEWLYNSYLQIQRELKDGHEVRRCTLSPLMQASPEDNAFPGLPAFDQFEFVGYTTAEGRSLVERWRRVVKSGLGEGGAAEGESLTVTHEMFIVRERGQAVPLRYSVVTDSSVLGAKSDSYTHRYNLLDAPTSAVLPDTSQDCDIFEEYPVELEQHSLQKRAIGLVSRVLANFDPIREFAGPTRDIRYDSIFSDFKKQFKRIYLDPAEEAVRKNLLVKSSRFIEAGNRLSSGFKMAANFMADRLDDEINQLLGFEAPPEGASEPGLVPFPYSENEVKSIKLDDEFDWRPLGAVSPVRFQDTTCSSCWAFAVAGSTEGALFKKTNTLVPLSPQCLVDCGKPFGTNGCNGTWPSFAYDYVKARGLPAWDEYTNYQAKVLQCKDQTVPPVTHISGHVNVTAFSEEALKVAIKNHAPSVVIVDAKAQSFIYYKSGVLKDKRCGENKPRLNHAVLAVGWGTKDGPHFIIKNTWSDKWGEGGYIRIAPDSCAVLEWPSYSLVEEPNIDRAELRAAAASIKA